MTGHVVSDLHLLSPRSSAEDLMDEIQDAAKRSDVFVLNGDIFDFHWSELPTDAETIAYAVDWLEALVNRHGNCQLHYVHGNHDCGVGFIEALRDLSTRLDRFRSHEDHVRLGSSLFLHGDCATWRMTPKGLAALREQWRRIGRRGVVRLLFWGFVDRSGLARPLHSACFPRDRTVRWVAHYVGPAGLGLLDKVTDIYFGHTHLPFTNRPHNGVRFHNTGAAVRQMVFQMLRFETGRLC